MAVFKAYSWLGSHSCWCSGNHEVPGELAAAVGHAPDLSTSPQGEKARVPRGTDASSGHKDGEMGQDRPGKSGQQNYVEHKNFLHLSMFKTIHNISEK